MPKKTKAATPSTRVKKPAAEPWKRNVEVGKSGHKFRIRSQQFRTIKRKNLERDPLNWRTHGDKQVAALRGALSEIGFVGALLVRRKPNSKTQFLVIDGHARLSEFAPDDGVPCCVANITDTEARKLLATFDTISGMAGADRATFEKLIEGIEFSTDELDDMIDDALKSMPELEGFETPLEPPAAEHAEEPPAVASEKRIAYGNKLRKKWETKRGQIWEIPSKNGGGVHRLAIGDVSHDDEIAKLLAGARVDCLLMDPPYCSGGFQESGKREGSIGTDDKSDEIHGDRVSTRGYRELLKTAFKAINPTSVLCFTDWRMWINTVDVVESEGHAVRQLIVWDKLYAGFGAGFRAQHELICFGARKQIRFEKSTSGGNVIQCARTMNKRHPSEKPLDLLLFLLRVHNTARVVCDPFAGSGTTLIAAEQKGRTCYAMELIPRHAAFILERAAEAGLQPTQVKQK